MSLQTAWTTCISAARWMCAWQTLQRYPWLHLAVLAWRPHLPSSEALWRHMTTVGSLTDLSSSQDSHG